MNKGFASNKFLPPTLHPKVLYREAVVSTLVEAITIVPSSQAPPYKLVLLCAPAGYGKTLVLADAVKHASVPCCWYFLEPLDTNPLLLLRGILASIRQCFPTLSPRLDVPFPENDERVSPECCVSYIDTLLSTLKEEVAEPFLLAFCNYHAVNRSPTINHLMNYLLAHLPEQGILVIESRVMPTLELAPIIARRQLFGLGSEVLRFTAQEVYELAHLQGLTTVTMQEAEQIALSFDGWITGILLGSSL
jgi:ATP/maltotriose-dependent transcriptional regulator MalT